MSSKDGSCRKFQANIFNKSKCQNCFKPRESHLLNDEDLNQAKPTYGGWLLLAPEGTNFDNPLHRSRKWQRRFFVLYEHGLLRYALDEMPSTLPQGTINMNQCSDVVDGESRTGQKNSLGILTPERDHFVRAECKEIINGWQEALTVYPRTNKHNLKKKRKVEPPTPQEPGPAKVAVTSVGTGGGLGGGSIAGAERVPATRSSLWQDEPPARWSRTSSSIPYSRSSSCISQLDHNQDRNRGPTTQDDGGVVSSGRKPRVESGYFSLEKTKYEPADALQPPPQHPPLSSPSSSSSASLGTSSLRYTTSSSSDPPPAPPSPEPLPSTLLSPSYSAVSSSQSSLDSEPSDYAALADVPRARRLNYREAFRTERKRQELRARARSPGREEVVRLFGEERRRSQVIGRFKGGPPLESMDTQGSADTPPEPVSAPRQGRPERCYLANRLEMSLDTGRASTDSSSTPDLLNFKKGWMTKLYEDGMWKKHWFVLTDQSLRFYKDSIAEEASALDGEVDLSSCYDVTEFPVQRNYGFQILAILKNVRPASAPDVTRSLPEEQAKVQLSQCLQSPTEEPLAGPEAPRSEPAGAPASEPRKSRVRERRREGRSKTYDWSEFRTAGVDGGSEEGAGRPDRGRGAGGHAPNTVTVTRTTTLNAAPPPQSAPPPDQGAMEVDGQGGAASDGVSQRRSGGAEEGEEGRQGEGHHVEIEERWHQVETTPLREEKQVPIATATTGSADRRPPRELATLLNKELGEKQKELDRLQEQNLHLKEQLDEARGREHSPREGYVLQVPPPPPQTPTQTYTTTRGPQWGTSWFHLNHNMQ
ncbi:hypothetical protein NHX12_025215 [Muraenolepis orangiensis]|uniref:PH domain-containing protein n=1 Tax=Muraenolepis orangiensis TaxID=630683 RepID=A0A9Q0EME9_9TELE|nr:hypothetical protein NHX12_025215 [Muraenolepis orangiensis]